MALQFLTSKPKKRDQIVVLDLGSRTIKAVFLQAKNEKYRLIKYAIQDAPITDQTPSPEILAEHLQKAWQALGTRTRQVVLGLGVAEAILKPAEMPMAPVSDLRMMLKFNSKGFLQQELPDYIFDCFVVPLKTIGAAAPEAAKSGQKMKVLVGGAKKQVLTDLQAAAKQAGLVADHILPSVIGPINAFELAQADAYQKDVVALVDLGYKNSTVSILQAGELMLHRVVGIGGHKLTAGLAEAMNISYPEAEGIKVGMPQEVEGALMPQITPLGRELRASIDFFEHQHDKTVSTIYMSGGSARSEFIVQALQTELMVPCKTWNPASFLELALSPQQLAEADQVMSQLTVAIGMAAGTM